MENLHNEIKNCIDVLKSGGLILYPTDTVWGLGCDATNESAVAKIFKLKQRSDSKSLIILIDNENRLLSYVQQVPEQAYQLIEFTEKPLTIVYEGAKNLAGNVINSDGTIGIRVTKDLFCKNLLERFRKPIVSTSANISGQPNPSCFSDINSSIIAGVDYVVNLRQEEKMNPAPSAIIKLGTKGEIQFLRT